MWNIVASFLHSINIHTKKRKTRTTCEIFETGYTDTSFQVVNRTEI